MEQIKALPTKITLYKKYEGRLDAWECKLLKEYADEEQATIQRYLVDCQTLMTLNDAGATNIKAMGWKSAKEYIKQRLSGYEKSEVKLPWQ